MINELLPLINGWSREIKEFGDIKIPEGTEKVIAEGYYSGWVVAAGCLFEGPKDTQMILYIHDPDGSRHPVVATPDFLSEMGLVGKSALNGGAVTRYSDELGIGAVILNPPEPIPFFASRDYPIRFSVKAVSGDVGLIYLGYYVVYIIDEDTLVKGLNRIFGGIPPITGV